MTTNDDKDKKSAGNAQDNLERIKKEEKEDASSYYSHGKEEHEHDLKAEYAKALPSVDPVKEEFNMMRALSYLAFGGASLALVFILFFVRDLDKRVDTMGKEVGDIDSKIEPFKKEVNGNISKINGDLDGLKNKVAHYERMVAVMELKRAMVAIEEITSESSPEVKGKSSQVVASIQSLLDEFAPAATPKGAASTEAAPEAAKPAEAPAAPPAAGAAGPAVTASPEAAPPATPTPAGAQPPAETSKTEVGKGPEGAKPPAAVGEVKLKKEEPKAKGGKAAKKKGADDDDDDDDDDD